MSTGMTMLIIFVCYSNALCRLCSFTDKTERPPITFSILCWFFLLGLLGCMAQLLGYAGINYSSPTLGMAMLNLVPALTFVLAVIFRFIPLLMSLV